MAVAVRVLVQVLLVLVFRRVEVLQRQQFGGKFSGAESGRGRPEYGFQLGPVGGIGIIDAGAVARAFVFALFIQAQRVDYTEEQPCQVGQGQHVGVVPDMHCLGVAGGVGIYLTVGRGRGAAVGEAYFGGQHAADQPEELFGSPEASRGEIDVFFVHTPCKDTN